MINILYFQNEIYDEIFKYLELKELINIRKICKKWNFLIICYIKNKYKIKFSYRFWKNEFSNTENTIINYDDKLFNNKYKLDFLTLIEYNICLCLNDKFFENEYYEILINNIIKVFRIMKHNKLYYREFFEEILKKIIQLSINKIMIFLQNIKITVIEYNGKIQIHNELECLIQIFVNLLSERINKIDDIEIQIKNIDIFLLLYRNLLISREYMFYNNIINIYNCIDQHNENKYIKMYIELLTYIILKMNIEEINENIYNYIRIIDDIIKIKHNTLDVVDKFKLKNIKEYLLKLNIT